MTFNYYQRPSTIQHSDVSSEEEDNIQPNSTNNTNNDTQSNENKRKRKTSKDSEEEKMCNFE